MKILVADSLDPRHFEALDGTGIEVCDRSGITADELVSEIAGFDALVVRSRTKVTDDVLAAGEGLKVIGRAGTGVDNIDVAAATRRGILVMNTPGANSNSAAEHAIAMMMATARRLPPADRSVREGRFDKKPYIGVELRDKTIAVLGLGRIGLLVARKARGLGMRVVGYDPVVSSEVAKGSGVELMSLEDVATCADFVTVHVPLMDATRHLVGEDLIRSMKPGVRIINCARGGIVDEAALDRALSDGHVAGAALDVFEEEPPGDSPLFHHDNVVVTPHLGASTEEAQAIVSRAVLEQVAEYLRGGIIRGAINGLPIDAETRDAIGPYLELSLRLGRIMAGLARRGQTLRACYYGPLASVNVRALTSFFLKGYLTGFLGEETNELNAYDLARERGLVIEETTRDEHRSFQSLIYFILESADGESNAVAGTVFGKSSLRIVRINEHNLDAVPEGSMLVIRNEDRPGIIGLLGEAMGQAGVNIANMAVSRGEGKAGALAILNLDSKPPASVLDNLRGQDGIASVQLVNAEA